MLASTPSIAPLVQVSAQSITTGLTGESKAARVSTGTFSRAPPSLPQRTRPRRSSIQRLNQKFPPCLGVKKSPMHHHSDLACPRKQNRSKFHVAPLLP